MESQIARNPIAFLVRTGNAYDGAARDLAHLSGERLDRTRSGCYLEFPL